VVGVVEDDDGVAAGVGAGDLHSVLDRFGAGVQQHGALLVVTRGQAVEGFGDLDVALVGADHEAGVREGPELSLRMLDHAGVRVAGSGHGDSRAEVDVLVAIDVLEDRAAACDHVGGMTRTDTGGHGRLASRLEFAGLRSGNLGDDLTFLRQSFAAILQSCHKGKNRGSRRFLSLAVRWLSRSSASVLVNGENQHRCGAESVATTESKISGSDRG
jgi:hypothetical protein